MEASTKKKTAQAVVKDIKRHTYRIFNAEEKIRIVIEGLRGEESIAAICRKNGINDSLYYKWSKIFLEAGKKRLTGDTERDSTTEEVQQLKKDNDNLKRALADLYLHNEVLKKSLTGLE